MTFFISVAVPIFPLFIPRLLLLRLLSIYFSLGVVMLLFSINHDALFLPFFSFHLFLWLLMENSMTDASRSSKVNFVFCILFIIYTV